MPPVIHPGQHLAEFLNEAGLNAAELARALHVPRNRVTRILNRRCSVSLDMAVRLGRFFGQSPNFWLNLQLLHDSAAAERNGIIAQIHKDIQPYAWVAA